MTKDRRAIETPVDVIFASASEIAAAVRAKHVSALEVVNVHLARIEEVNPSLNALVQVGGDAARKEARMLDAALARGELKGPLHGVPISIKDTIEAAGLPCAAGTLGRKDFVPAEDATVVARLRAAGAILLGKGNTPEFACAFETDNLAYGRTNNPHDPSRTPGGSTGGDAAIISAGGSVLAMGTDAGGSIRLPAHYCGLAALKPTMNRTPRTGAFHYPIGLRMPLSTISPIARYVDDLITVLPIVSGPDGRDFSVPDAMLHDPGAVSTRGLRIAFFIDDGVARVTAEIEGAVRKAADVLAAAGAEMVEMQPPGVEDAYPLWSDLFGDGGDGLRALLKNVGSSRASPLLDRSLETIFAARLKTAADVYRTALRWDQFRLRMQAFLRSYDALLSPACAFPAPLHGTTFNPDKLAGCAYTMLHNLTGWPATVVRGGTSPEGLPIGVQIAAHYWREDISLALARELERRLGHFTPQVKIV
jgi:amidase